METNRFYRAINALVTAFFDDTLAKGDSCGCAVGNIVAASYGTKVEKSGSHFSCKVDNYRWFHYLHYNNEDAIGIDNVLITGYSKEELLRIEKAFEDNTHISKEHYYEHTKEGVMEDQYNGLMAVVEVLCEIEGIEDKQEYKQMFEYV